MHDVLALVFAFGLAALLGFPLIKRLQALSLRQVAYEDAPATHQTKTGTPTMGGIIFIVAPITALIMHPDPSIFALSFLMIGCGLVGMIDDRAAIRQQRNQGLTPLVKLCATATIGLLFLIIASVTNILHDTVLTVPLMTVPAWLVVSLALFAILGTTHAVNLTDGLDGLAGGSMIPPLMLCAWLAARNGQADLVGFSLALIGAVLGFLLYNRHPAQVFMGDTGALALGAALAGISILSGTTLLLPLIAGVFFVEALSVIAQVVSFKYRGKRIFRMSPLHHHFELGGMREIHVTQIFWFASLICCLCATAIVLVV